MTNWKGCRKKWPRPNFRYYPSICLEGSRKTMKNLIKDSQSLGPPKYEAGALTTCHSVDLDTDGRIILKWMSEVQNVT
jgi:hypothetical protein